MRLKRIKKSIHDKFLKKISDEAFESSKKKKKKVSYKGDEEEKEKDFLRRSKAKKVFK